MMRFLLLFLWVSSVAAAPLSVDLQEIRLRDLARLVWGDIAKKSYVLDTAALNHQELVTVSFQRMEPPQVEAETIKLLEGHGFTVQTVRGVVHVRKQDAEKDEGEVFVYRPQFRPVSYLVDLASTLFQPGAFMSQRRGSGINIAQVSGTMGQAAPLSRVAEQGANAAADRDPDVLLFRGPVGDVQRLQKLLAQLDSPTGEVLVKAVVFEVQSGQREGSAVDLALSIVKGKIGVNFTQGAGSGAFVKASGLGVSIDGIYSALSSDDRFKVVTTPRLRVRSGGSARFSVGNETPVLGKLTFDQNNRPVQSVDYKPSGVIFELRPQLRDGGAELAIVQQISQFVPTTNGVNNTPTLIKRELSTQVTARDGEVILIGGLDEDRTAANESGLSFLPRFLRASSKEQQRTEIVLMLHVERI